MLIAKIINSRNCLFNHILVSNEVSDCNVTLALIEINRFEMDTPVKKNSVAVSWRVINDSFWNRETVISNWSPNGFKVCRWFMIKWLQLFEFCICIKKLVSQVSFTTFIYSQVIFSSFIPNDQVLFLCTKRTL